MARRKTAFTKGRRGAELAAVAGTLVLAVVLVAAWELRYEGPRGMAPYEIDGMRYEPRPAPPGGEFGIASWYGEPFHGRAAANGTVYDQEAFTAAHPTWPLGTRVRVTDLETGKSVLLKITDRGPFVDGRVIDVSRRAARKLGFLHDGLAEVHVQPLHSPFE